MAELGETPRGSRVHIAFFGLRNAGKSTLVNAFTGQSLAIVSDVAGTTTDPVSKAMEILPLGPCLVTDTAGLDDVGDLGRQRVEKSLRVLETADIAVWVFAPGEAADDPARAAFLAACRRRGVTTFDFRRGDSVEDLKRKIADVRLAETPPGLLDGLVSSGSRVLCIVPIDESAPKGRLILPQQQVLRDCLDRGAVCSVCQPAALLGGLVRPGDFDLAITDSQAFRQVAPLFERGPRLTSFSILFARQKGDLAAFVRGLQALRALKDGDTVLVAEGCTHHRQCNDIGAVKIPKAIQKLSGRTLNFVFASGPSFFDSLVSKAAGASSGSAPKVSLVVHCGGCMLTRREVLRRIGLAQEADVPIVNYGMVLAAAGGLRVEEVLV